MPYRIICFTKILTLAVAPFLFILVGVVFEFAVVPDVYILLLRKKRHTTLLFLRVQIEKFSSTFIKDKVVVELEKNTNKEFICVMVFIKRLRDTLKFQFIFDFNECL